jgi:toxin YoeB
MLLSWSEHAWEDYLYWQTADKKLLKRINALIKDIQRHPFTGMVGSPEPLRHNWAGYWSRRISREHRLVYKATDNAIFVVQCRYHY